MKFEEKIVISAIIGGGKVSSILKALFSGIKLNFVMSNGNPIVLSYGGVQLREDDSRAQLQWNFICFTIISYSVALLRGPFWLNDQIIEFYLRYMENRLFQAHPDKFLFVSPAVTQLIKMGADDVSTFLAPLQAAHKKVLFFPVNDEQLSGDGSHWSLLVYSRDENTFFSFDSSDRRNRKSANQLVTVLRRGFGCPPGKHVCQSCHQQSNQFDCGICILAFIEKICQYFIKKKAVQGVAVLRPGVTKKRLEMLGIIHQLSRMN